MGQGAVAITARTDDDISRDLVAAIACHATAMALAAERAFLTVLDGSCRTPIAGHATVSNGRLHFAGEVLRADGSEVFAGMDDGALADAAAIGRHVGEDVLRRLPSGILAAH